VTVVRTRGLRISRPGGPARFEPVELPPPRGREVLVAVAAVGLCGSDLHVVDGPPAPLDAALPFTLGHEIAGTVAMVGGDVRGVRAGAAVAVYGPWGCGACPRCREGSENYCAERSRLGYAGAGLGRDGGIAGAVLVPHERHLLPLAGLDPVQAAPLTDAGLTSYHAVSLVLPRLPADPVVAVLGVGGLGHLAIQVVRALAPGAVIVATDVRAEALELATRCGAQHAVRSDLGAAGILAATGGHGADAVLDLVGSQQTLDLAAGLLRPGGDLVAVGSGGGRLAVAKSSGLPAGIRVSLPFWGSRPDLERVLALARAGALRAEVETFPFSQAGQALDRLRAGTIRGRAVLVPD
jgi:propanol-preferring alcohol dehydrogenase